MLRPPHFRAYFSRLFTHATFLPARHAIRLVGHSQRSAAAGYYQCAFIIVDMTTKLVSVVHDICTKTVSMI